MLFIGGNGIERQSTIQGLFATQLFQFIAGRQFRLLGVLLQPLQESHHCHTVTHHGTTKALLLSLALHRFHQGYRRCCPHHFALNALEERVVHLICVYQDIVLEIVAQALAHLFIGSHTDAVVIQVSLHLVGQLLLINI